MSTRPFRVRVVAALLSAAVVLFAIPVPSSDRHATAQTATEDAPVGFSEAVRPLVKKYCLDCHSTKAKKGSLDLERFATLDDVRKDLKPWQQPDRADRSRRDAAEGEAAADGRREEAAARLGARLPRRRGAGPGRRPGARAAAAAEQRRVRLHDPRPDRRRSAADARVPRRRGGRRGLHQRRRGADRHLAGAASPSTSTRPRTSPTTRSCCRTASASRRRRRAATGPTRAPPRCGSSTPLTRPATAGCRCSRTSRRPCAIATRSPPGKVDGGRGEGEAEREVPRRAVANAHGQDAVAAARRDPREVAGRDREGRAGARGRGRRVAGGAVEDGPGRQLHSGELEFARRLRREPDAAGRRSIRRRRTSVPLRLAVKPAPGQSEVVLYLAAHESRRRRAGRLAAPAVRGARQAAAAAARLRRSSARRSRSITRRSSPTARSTSPRRSEAANDRKLSLDELAKKHGLDAAFLKRWIEVLAVEPFRKDDAPRRIGRVVPAVALELLGGEDRRRTTQQAGDQRLAQEGHRPARPGHELVRQGGADSRPRAGARRRRSSDAEGVRRGRVEESGRRRA